MAKAKTWERDIHSLYDYDFTGSLHQRDMLISCSGFLCRTRNQVTFIPEGEFVADSGENTVLCYVLLENEQLVLLSPKGKLKHSVGTLEEM